MKKAIEEGFSKWGDEAKDLTTLSLFEIFHGGWSEGFCKCKELESIREERVRAQLIKQIPGLDYDALIVTALTGKE